MNKFVFGIAIVAAMGGFLFGFDTAVISGAEQAIQAEWQLDNLLHGLAMAVALYGTVLGAMFGGWPSNKYGRKKTLMLIGILYTISALGSALAPEIYSFMFFRFIGGLGVGASSVAAPLYISEISPAASRGRLVALFQFNIVLGILIAYFSNYLLADISAVSWRWMLGVETIPALAFSALVFLIPESPRWLILVKGDTLQAKAILTKVEPLKVDQLIEQIKASASESFEKVKLFSSKFSQPLMLAFFFAFFNQLSGINAIIYYAPRIFKMTGLADGDSLFATAGIGLVNLIFTVLGMLIIDRVGRKKLMYVGSIGLIISLSLIARAFLTENFDGVANYFFFYIACFAMSQGAVIWVFLSEIFPNMVRASGQAFGSLTHWVFAAIIANIFPYLAGTFDSFYIFGFFSFMMILQLLFVWIWMPETKGVGLEELQKRLGIK
jgi:MFS transporter, SP family, arabinose:H+ symporter